MEAKYTKGDWEVSFKKGDFPHEHLKFPETIRTKEWGKSDLMADYKGNVVCSFDESHGDRCHAIKEAEANARLIAAAPDLLHALVVCHAALSTYEKHPIIDKQVENAIKKASGI